MAGEIIYELGSHPLSRYSYNLHREKLYPTMHTIEMDLAVLEIILDGDEGEIMASYLMRYLDSSGKLLMLNSASSKLPTRWIIERQGDNWVIVDVDEHP
jgi:hypothetical protein